VNKYRAKPVTTEEGRFASQREYQHWCVSKLRQKAGEITHLERQVRFKLAIGPHHICDYVADEIYFDKASQTRVVVDVKGVKTPVYRLKKKLMKALLNIDVVEA
jgi:hypothetical protein